jgi:hypothetical protein
MRILAQALAKVTAKNQLTIPDRIMEAVGRPTHFRLHVADNGQILMEAARLRTEEEMAAGAGIPAEVLRRAYALVEQEKAAVPAGRKARHEG